MRNFFKVKRESTCIMLKTIINGDNSYNKRERMKFDNICIERLSKIFLSAKGFDCLLFIKDAQTIQK